jgi:perosamine synthetase
MKLAKMTERAFIPLASPDIREADIEEMVRVVRTGMLVQGKEVAAFEESVQRFLGVGHAVCVTNGTATMHLALLALGIGPSDEVIVPAFSYMATANVVELVGAKPVFADIEPRTFNIDSGLVRRLITPATRAIIPVHEFGLACDITGIMRIAEERGLHVIEDAACALGARENGRAVGTFGRFGSFSLHPRKAITSGEGGILTTNDAAMAERIRILRNHGIHPARPGMDFVAAGFNCRMTDYQAALVHSQFHRLPGIIERRQALARVYFEEIRHPAFVLPETGDGKLHTWQSFHCLVDEGLDRARVMEFLKENGIGTNYGAQCMPAQTWFRNKYGHDSEVEFPHAWRAFTRGLALPLYEKLSFEDIKYISSVINRISG